MARLYRRHPDSSTLSAPRVFARVFPEAGALVECVNFYRDLTGAAPDMDMDFPEANLHVVAVGPFLILELVAEDRGLAAETTVTVLNADLEAAAERAIAAGAVLVQARWQSPPGPGMRLRHPDGLLVEYLEHRPSPDDVSEPGSAFR